MSYCVAMLLDMALVLLADSRTHAGVDQIGTCRKAKVFEASRCVGTSLREACCELLNPDRVDLR